jgi:hypothetical protein
MNQDERTDIPRRMLSPFRDRPGQKCVELQRPNQMQRQPWTTKLPQVFDANATRVDFDPARFNGRLFILELKTHLPPERLHLFRFRDWLDRLPGHISCLLNTQSSSLVKFSQPSHHALPWTVRRAMRFHQRPVSVPLSVFRSVALANKHDREC